jgi:hypothetical protein
MKEFTLQKYRDLGAILTDSFVYIRVHFKTLGKALLLLVLPFYLISGMLVGNAYSSFFTTMMENPDLTGDTLFGNNFLLGLLLLALSSGALLTITLTHVQLVREHGEATLSNIVNHFSRNFFTLLLLYIIIIIVVPISFLFFIVPGIYIGIKLFLSPAVAVLEQKNPFDAINRSWDLVQGHWWFTAAVYLVMNIITSFMSYVLVIPFGILVSLATVSGADTSGMVGTGMGIFYALMIVFGSLFSVIMLIAMCLHYFNLIERKEGEGLRAKIEELG